LFCGKFPLPVCRNLLDGQSNDTIYYYKQRFIGPTYHFTLLSSRKIAIPNFPQVPFAQKKYTQMSVIRISRALFSFASNAGES
jgi:hypothetical protein